ncbi:MAG: hypothetical protein KC503_41880, partial [Myxococcales bacterium]|nr:hypothetical protein [Myxococcales bacterium]
RILLLLLLLLMLLPLGCGDSAVGADSALHAPSEAALDVGADVDAGDAALDATPDTRADGPSPDGTADTRVDGPLPDVGPPGPGDACAAPLRLTFSGGRASASGNTRAFTDELQVSCQGAASAAPLAGGDRYYVFTAAANMTYEIRVTVARPQVVYGFAQSVGCTPAAVQSACSSAGAQGFRLAATPAAPNAIAFAPSSAGDYVVAIDSESAAFGGDYTLEIIERPTPPNGRCAQPQALVFSNGRAVVSGDTRGALDELPALTCSGASPFRGPQLYYELDAKANRAYRLTLEPSFDAYLYLFDANAACTQPAVQASCADGGISGASFSSALAPGARRSLLFQPAAAGRYKVAVDSWLAAGAGPFTLTVDEIAPPANDACSAAQTLTLPSGGAAVVATGDLTLATDEHATLDCGLTAGGMPAKLSARDVFYRFAAVQGQSYVISVRSDFDAVFYLWNDSQSACSQATIEAGCVGGASADGDHSMISNGTSFVFTAKQTATYGIGIEDFSGEGGAFSLRVAEHAPPTNTTCATAQALTLGSNNKVSVAADTTGVADEFPNLSCSSVFASTRLVGANLYYSFDGKAGRIYRLSLDARFAGYVIVFDSQANCIDTDVQISCGSNGANGDSFPRAVFAGSLLFKPPRDAKYIVAVDTFNPAYMGAFTLDIEDVGAVPAHTTCAGAQQVTLQNGSATINDDTTLGVDQFSILKCGGLAQRARQLYYRFAASAGKTYRLELTPSFDAYAYLFVASTNCAFGAIDSACASNGASGTISPFTIAGTTSVTTFTASASGDLIVGVDSTDIARFGPFTLTILEQ